MADGRIDNNDRRREFIEEAVIYQSLQRDVEAKAEARKQRETATNLLRESLPVEIIVRITDLSIEEVQELQPQINLQN
ncbi:hypothetical protein IQ244_16285 [Nostoc sp. LEGE 06077]|uniref:hypothetical protein n=1 Tax=Nostoc sp. LEGE 06077 TaxID=915325 RepID=UPI00187F60F1|nr:hypothetical protein [Nostoc sp. LEGE 06077]MBE9208054.1 hypothetical protein [Nostoc sp. LEGE 06077]